MNSQLQTSAERTSASNAASPGPLGVDGSSWTCRVGAIEVQDSYSPTASNPLPSPAAIRALRSAVSEKSSAQQPEVPPSKFLVREPFAAMSFGSANLPMSSASNADLWYAQAAIQQVQQVKELSFKPFRSFKPRSEAS